MGFIATHSAHYSRPLKALLGTRATDAQAVREHHSHGESYHVPAAPDVPPLRIAHRETPAGFGLGAKGIGEGNTMSAPAALANAVADALGVDDVELPLTPPRVWELLR